jgi:hypothetical protein
MGDARLVLDAYGRVADATPAAARLLDQRRNAVVGRYAGDLLSGAIER